MDLSVREVARLLSVSERTVSRWARQGTIPAHSFHDQYRFNRVELQEWAASQGRRVSPRLFAGGAPEPPPSLALALERGGVYPDVAGHTKAEVLRAVSRLSGVPAAVDRDLLYQLLLGRESLASTGIGGGIAVPHARDPVVLQVEGPAVLLGFLREPVDFGAPDGEPVRVVFTVFAPSIREHLRTISRLTFSLHDVELRRLLEARAAAEPILARVRQLDRARVSGPVAAVPEPGET